MRALDAAYKDIIIRLSPDDERLIRYMYIVCPTRMHPVRVKSQNVQKCGFRSPCVERCSVRLRAPRKMVDDTIWAAG